MNPLSYVLLKGFRELFEGHQISIHRNSSLGDRIASFLYEDLVLLGKSTGAPAPVEVKNGSSMRKSDCRKAPATWRRDLWRDCPGDPCHECTGLLGRTRRDRTIEIGTVDEDLG